MTDSTKETTTPESQEVAQQAVPEVPEAPAEKGSEAPTPGNVPGPKPTPKVAAPVPNVDDEAAAEAAKWGRVDDEGNVWLRASGEDAERIVGQYAAGGTEKDALGLYVRRFLDLQGELGLLEQRIEHVAPDEVIPSAKALREQLAEPAVVGDVQSLRNRLTAVEKRIEERKAEYAKERAEAKEQSLAERTAIVEAAEAVANQDPDRTHWRDSRQELSNLLDQWKYAQRHSPRIDRPTEQKLWKRFSSARTKFDRHRRQFFSTRDAQRKETVARKEELIAAAIEIQNSTDWGPTSAQYRELMNEWKRAGRSTKKEDDKLWERFRAAQQVFFDARNAFNSELDEEYSANLEQKLELLKEAEKLLPVKDVEEAKAAIRRIGEKWDAIGRVPRNDVSRTEGRMRDIERAIRDAESEEWRKSDPEVEERTSGMAEQLQNLITELEGQIEEAKAAGDDDKVKEYTAALEARKAWLGAVLDE